MTDKEIIKALEYYQSIDIIRKDGKSPLSLLTAEIRAEAIKEFSENIKLEFYKEFDEIISSIMADKIDNLVKEMVGK